jgi:hypothetical protein
LGAGDAAAASRSVIVSCMTVAAARSAAPSSKTSASPSDKRRRCNVSRSSSRSVRSSSRSARHSAHDSPGADVRACRSLARPRSYADQLSSARKRSIGLWLIRERDPSAMDGGSNGPSVRSDVRCSLDGGCAVGERVGGERVGGERVGAVGGQSSPSCAISTSVISTGCATCSERAPVHVAPSVGAQRAESRWNGVKACAWRLEAWHIRSVRSTERSKRTSSRRISISSA